MSKLYDSYKPSAKYFADFDEFSKERETKQSRNQVILTINGKSIQMHRYAAIDFVQLICAGIPNYKIFTPLHIISVLEMFGISKSEIFNIIGELSEKDFVNLLAGKQFPYVQREWDRIFQAPVVEDIRELSLSHPDEFTRVMSSKLFRDFRLHPTQLSGVNRADVLAARLDVIKNTPHPLRPMYSLYKDVLKDEDRVNIDTIIAGLIRIGIPKSALFNQFGFTSMSYNISFTTNSIEEIIAYFDLTEEQAYSKWQEQFEIKSANREKTLNQNKAKRLAEKKAKLEQLKHPKIFESHDENLKAACDFLNSEPFRNLIGREIKIYELIDCFEELPKGITLNRCATCMTFGDVPEARKIYQTLRLWCIARFDKDIDIHAKPSQKAKFSELFKCKIK